MSRSAVQGPAHAAFGIVWGLVLALQFSPLLGLLGYESTGWAEWAWIGSLRDLLAAALVASALVARWRTPAPAPLPASARWAIALVMLYGLAAMAHAGSGLFPVALNLRRLVLVPAVFFAVLIVPWTPRQIDALLRLLFATGVAVALFGIAERLLPDSLWIEVLDVQAYTTANNFDPFGAAAFHESGRFFSNDLDFVLANPVRRMISSYLEPTTLAAGMAALLCQAMARRARGHGARLAVALALVCGLATLSKGFAAFLVLLAAWQLTGAPSARHAVALVMLVCGAALLAEQLHLDGPLAHVAGLVSALRHLLEGNWWGQGLGGAGNYTDSGSEVGGESGLGNVIAQIGVVAAVSLAWLGVLGRDLLGAAAARRDPGGPWLASWLVFWAVTYALSASSLGVGGNAVGFLLLGLYLHPASGVAAPGRPSPAPGAAAA